MNVMSILPAVATVRFAKGLQTSTTSESIADVEFASKNGEPDNNNRPSKDVGGGGGN